MNRERGGSNLIDKVAAGINDSKGDTAAATVLKRSQRNRVCRFVCL